MGIDEINKGINGQFSDESGFASPKGFGSDIVDAEVIEQTVRGFALFSEFGQYNFSKSAFFLIFPKRSNYGNAL